MLATVAGAALPALAQVGQYQVQIRNLAPQNGTALTPVWVGFQNGMFNSYTAGAAAPLRLERLAEDGDTSVITSDFAASGFGSQQATIRSDRAGMPPVLLPGETATQVFTLDASDPLNRYFSFLTMVIPSNDAFVGNGPGTAFQLFDAAGVFTPFSRTLSGAMVRDAGTEVNDEIPMNTAFFGQTMGNTGVDENGVVGFHPGFIPGGPILSDPMFANANFLAPGYNVLEITVTQVPAPSAAALLGVGGLAALRRRRR
jgi:MYXO-CTERM domain-containing protein